MQILEGKAFQAGETAALSVLRQRILGTCTEQQLECRNRAKVGDAVRRRRGPFPGGDLIPW